MDKYCIFNKIKKIVNFCPKKNEISGWAVISVACFQSYSYFRASRKMKYQCTTCALKMTRKFTMQWATFEWKYIKRNKTKILFYVLIII